MEDLAGRQFGPYRVVAPLGEGGMAAVYQAYQPSVDRYVALKVLSRYFTSDPQFLERFRREAKVVAQLQHPHILPVFDFGESGGYTFLVMPFVQGGTLAELLTGSPVSLAVTARVIRQVCEALDYAHSKGIVHRDIKPSNILIDERGNCLVADFGLARIAEGSTKLTQTGAVLGTPAYMSPEQAAGKDIGPHSDIYSVGIVLYEMLTGRVPFQAETPIAVAIKHLNDPLPPPRSLNPALTAGVEAVILKALARSRSERFSSGEALATALTTAIQSIQQGIGTEFLTPEQAGARVPSGITQVVAPELRSPAGPPALPSKSAVVTAPELFNSAEAPTVPFTRDADHASISSRGGSEQPWWIALGVAGVLFLFLVLLTHVIMQPPGQSADDTPPEPRVSGVQWAQIPAGSFEMGCTPGQSVGPKARGIQCGSHAHRHRVTISRPFEMMTTEATVAMSKAAGSDIPRQPEWSGDNHPVVNINWFTATALCRAVGGRLPTEAEWEYAARGGVSDALYPWGNESPVCSDGRSNGARFDDDAGCDGKSSTKGTVSVGRYAPNGYGLYDMAGNVWEWVADWYGPYEIGMQSDPRGSASGGTRVLRGGSWNLPPAYMSVWNRSFGSPESRHDDIRGVRCARDISQ